MAMRMRSLLAAAARRATDVQATRLRSFHASSSVLARQSRRGGRTTRGAMAQTPNPFEDGDDNEETEDGKLKKTATFFTMGELDENPDLKSSGIDDDDEEEDEETKEFLKGVDELFALEPKAFEKRLMQMDPQLDGSDDADDDSDEEEEEEIDRAERIPKKRLLKVLDEFDAMKPRSGKNTERMAVPKTKIAAPLEKKVNKFDPERISHRQERIELSVVDFVQNLLLEDSDMIESNVFAHIVEASVAPDLRRVILYWEPMRRNSDNQDPIGKKKVEGVQRRLEKLEKWMRMSVTRHLNLKYSPALQFKRYKQPQNEVARKLFDQEMAWLDRFK